MRRWVADKEELSIERREGVCTKEWGIEDRHNLAVSWYTGGRT